MKFIDQHIHIGDGQSYQDLMTMSMTGIVAVISPIIPDRFDWLVNTVTPRMKRRFSLDVYIAPGLPFHTIPADYETVINEQLPILLKNIARCLQKSIWVFQDFTCLL